MVSRRVVLAGIFWGLASCTRHGQLDIPQDDLPECASIDIDQYFSFTISDELKPLYFGHDYDPGDRWNADLETVQLIRGALQEIMNTDEGFRLIANAVERFNGNKIHLDIDEFNFVGEADAVAGVPFVRVSNNWAAKTQTYRSAGRVHNLSIQRLLVHELYHLSAGHVTGELQDYDSVRDQHEAEAVAFTDSYMAKYYGEASRREYQNVGFDGGTERWDFANRILGCRISF